LESEFLKRITGGDIAGLSGIQMAGATHETPGTKREAVTLTTITGNGSVQAPVARETVVLPPEG
jgi:hypothetical protein